MNGRLNHKEALFAAIEASGLSAKDISKLSSVGESTISRFLGGNQQDLRAGDFFAIANSLPVDARKRLWLSMSDMANCPSLNEKLQLMTPLELAGVVKTIANLLEEKAALSSNTVLENSATALRSA